MEIEERPSTALPPQTRWTGWLTRGLLVTALICVALAVAGGLGRSPIVATVPTLLQSATVLLLAIIVLMLDELLGYLRRG